MITSADVEEMACRFIGAPYMHKGRSRWGLDCIGLVVVVSRELGLCPGYTDPDYGSPPDPRLLQELLRGYLAPGSKEQPGDVLLFRFVREPQHVAIRTSYGLVHSYERVGRVVHTRFDRAWRSRCIAAFRFPGVA